MGHRVPGHMRERSVTQTITKKVSCSKNDQHLLVLCSGYYYYVLCFNFAAAMLSVAVHTAGNKRGRVEPWDSARVKASKAAAWLQLHSLSGRPPLLDLSCALVTAAAAASPSILTWRASRIRLLTHLVDGMSHRAQCRAAAFARSLRAPTFEPRLVQCLPAGAFDCIDGFMDDAMLDAVLIVCWGAIIARPNVFAMTVDWWHAMQSVAPAPRGRCRAVVNPWAWRSTTDAATDLTAKQRLRGNPHCPCWASPGTQAHARSDCCSPC